MNPSKSTNKLKRLWPWDQSRLYSYTKLIYFFFHCNGKRISLPTGEYYILHTTSIVRRQTQIDAKYKKFWKGCCIWYNCLCLPMKPTISLCLFVPSSAQRYFHWKISSGWQPLPQFQTTTTTTPPTTLASAARPRTTKITIPIGIFPTSAQRKIPWSLSTLLNTIITWISWSSWCWGRSLWQAHYYCQSLHTPKETRRLMVHWQEGREMQMETWLAPLTRFQWRTLLLFDTGEVET